jgi:hypothetical protein
MTAPYYDAESYGGYGDYELAEEATVRDHRAGPAKIFVPGGLSSATLNTPKGPAKLNLPSAVPTLQQYRTLEQAVSATNSRLAAATADLARLRQELAAQRQWGGGGGGMGLLFPLLLQKQLQDDLEGHTHVGSTAAAVLPTGGSGFSSLLLPLMLLQPGMFGQSAPGAPPGGQDQMSSMMMMFLMLEVFRTRGA